MAGQAVIPERLEPTGWDPAYLAMLAALPPMEEAIETVEIHVHDSDEIAEDVSAGYQCPDRRTKNQADR